MELENGVITQNRCYISYKTNKRSHNFSFIQSIVTEFINWMNETGFVFKEDNIQVYFSDGKYRLGYLTVYCEVENIEHIPLRYESNCVD